MIKIKKMKYIKKLNIDFNNWDTIDDTNIDKELLLYLRLMTGASSISTYLDKKTLNELGFHYMVYEFFDYYIKHYDEIDNNIKNIILRMKYDIVKRKNIYKYRFSLTTLKGFKKRLNDIEIILRYADIHYNEDKVIEYYKKNFT